MTDFKNRDHICFVGIGGIGMSALALYFAMGGYSVAGYDRTESDITIKLAENGCHVTHTDSIESLPPVFGDPRFRDRVLVVFTPAIPSGNSILTWFRTMGYTIRKRAEVLGEISSRTDTIAVAGTHGKTTVSTMTAHLLKQSETDCSAFLGGISKNYDSNLLLGEGKYTVMEADEYDRSFHRLSPLIAVITSLDPDHLDIYGDHDSMVRGYNEFIGKIRPGGKLIASRSIIPLLIIPPSLDTRTYGFEEDSDYRAFAVEREGDHYRFSIQTPEGVMENLLFAFPGIINIANLTAAIAVALICGVSEQEIRKAVLLFQGVKRRFDIRINLPGLVYIDDYAHHPVEIEAFVSSVREYFGERKITAIFQPHLFSRTRDHAEGFAEILDMLDEVILLPIYPAREEPVEGVTSELIFRRMRSAKKQMLEMKDLPDKLDVNNIDILLTIGAGSIDTLVSKIEEKLKRGVMK